ncbi:MAG TPA: TetR-like C-terminal domain-containing protein [Ktedonobacteraceae bacterium]|nr:TetR-like C-terminal domain-containing protein [Ktedonobacteraceae bacterium]
MAHRAGLDLARVVQAAADLADREGLEGVSLVALAAQLDVRSPTLYHYIEDGLAGVRRELALLGTQEMIHRLGRAVMGKAGDEAVIALANAYRGFANEHPGLYAATVQPAGPTDAALVAAQSELVEIVVRALSAYHLVGDEAIHAVRILRSAVHGFATLEYERGFGLALDLDESFRRLLQVFIAGLSRPTETGEQQQLNGV